MASPRDIMRKAIRAIGREAHQGARPWSLWDIDDERQRRALSSTAAFVDEHMRRAEAIRGKGAEAKNRLLDLGLELAPTDGLVVEFGVYRGGTLRRLVAQRTPVHGFDSFEGLPEDWRSEYGRGHFQTVPPSIEGAELHVGWFEETLPEFLDAYSDSFAFVHMDADLYRSTATVFKHAEARFVPGTIVLFDEYFNYPGWEDGEHKAFTEFIERTGHDFEYVAYNATHEQVVVKLTS